VEKARQYPAVTDSAGFWHKHGRWHVLRDGARLVLARRVPARFDVAAQTMLPLMSRGRLAHQVRQDLWRALQDLRGFSPVIEVTRMADHLHLRAGGQVACMVPSGVEMRIAEVIENPANRSRWHQAQRPCGARQEPVT